MSEQIVKSEFQIMDEADNEQIQEADKSLKQALVYEVRGKKQLSFMGIKWIVLKMSQKDQPLEVIDMPVVELSKCDPEDKTTWVWYCTIKVRNLKTGMVTVGASETTWLIKNKDGYGEYDTFGRTKAISKAERNAYRKQIPEIEINAMLNSVAPEDTQQLQNGNTSNSNPTNIQNTFPTPISQHYLDTLKNLGYLGVQPKTSFEASKLIENLKKKAKLDDYCPCNKFIPSSVNSIFCQTCGKKKPEDHI